MDKKYTVNHDFTSFIKIFTEQNARLNLISKNDEKVLYEKHIYDSLAIKTANCLKTGTEMLDIGCGGGFPSVPIAIEYPEVNVVALDSIRKKINAVNEMKKVLDLKNLSAVCDRAENLKGVKYDVITSRAVADLSKNLGYALPLLKKNGVFIAYKSKKAREEIKSAGKILSDYNAKVIDIIDYTLPLEETYNRCLILVGF